MQVRCNGRAVGHLNVYVSRYAGDAVTVARGRMGVDLPLKEFHAFVPDQIKAGITENEFQAMLKAQGVMQDEWSRIERDEVVCRTIYYWRAFDLDIDTYEWVFDLDHFTPA